MSRVVLASFDHVPSPKGACAHILANARILSRQHEVALATLGSEPLQAYRHRPFHLTEPNWLLRGLAFERRLSDFFCEYDFDVYHVRSPFEGLAVPPDRALIYEVNALYSVESAYHFPATAGREELRRKLRARELCVLDRARLVITPSKVTAQYLADLGADPGRIRVVANAPSLAPAAPARDHCGPVRICYVGSLAPWQGVHELLSLLPRLRGAFALSIAASGPKAGRRWAEKIVAKKGLADRVRFLDPMGPADLAAFLATQDIGLAPLIPSERNLVQGCNPIKLLDYAAAGVAVVAPDMPVVREILGDAYGLYRRWSRGAAIQRVDELIANAPLRAQLADLGRRRIAEAFSPTKQADRLRCVYEELTA